MKVCIFRYHHRRSKELAAALADGVAAMGWTPIVTDQERIVLSCNADVFASYGWVNKPLFDLYRDTGRTFLYLDLGYWSRKNGMGDYSGYHKVVVNGRHATAYFKVDRPDDRLDDAPTIQGWRGDGSHIVVAGMSAKSAPASGFRPLEWEHRVIAEIRKLCDRPIVYRPKPSWKDARPIVGTRFSSVRETIRDALAGAYGLVTLHSNAAIDALAAGVPICASEGLASAVSCESIAELINRPRRDMDREAFLRQVSYCHWTRHEISDGKMFAQMVEDRVLPCA